MAGRRRKRRTHIIPTEDKPITEESGGGGSGSSNVLKVPKSFVVRLGKVDGKNVGQLVTDVRRILEPNTAARLKERRDNKLKDYVNIAGPLGVTHLLSFTQTEEHVNFRVTTLPQGPTLYYQLEAYSLIKDICNSSKRPHSPGSEYRTSPLVVLNNFLDEGNNNNNIAVKLQRTLWQHMFPTLVPSQVKLNSIRRVVLLNRLTTLDDDNVEDDDVSNKGEIVQLRHYLIVINASTKRERILERALKNGADLSTYANVDDFINQQQQMQAESSGGESDGNQDTKVTLADDYLGVNNKKSQQRRIRLLELGPRMDLKLIKIVDGVNHNEGKVLWHA